MNRFSPNRSGLFTGCLVLTLGLFGPGAGVGQAQVIVKPTSTSAQLKKAELALTGNKTSTAKATASLNEGVRKYAESMLGKQVGSGECWDLANEALKAAGARQPGQGGYGSYVFGKEVTLKDVQPGDILQFENVVFKHTSANGSWSTNNFPHHTAVVKKVQGRQIELLHQNVNNDRHVQTSTISLDDKQPGGTLLAYRPQPR
jgi:hypothetical protein